ncbi:hypothetical protein [Thermonema rossianum]|jgi:uncharacterized membrane protein YvlD (DUF360 family)|uniref:hypothetical protein n=1 Tax=Thermonema rossianum TaxID=55505 RepID=UPI000570EFE4|nr:hypothetical protein [Thermonema rossianum]
MKMVLIQLLLVAICWAFFPGFTFDTLSTALLSALLVVAGYHSTRSLMFLLLFPISLPLLYINIKGARGFLPIAGLWLWIAAAHFVWLWIVQKLFSGFRITPIWYAGIAAALIAAVYVGIMQWMAPPKHRTFLKL